VPNLQIRDPLEQCACDRQGTALATRPINHPLSRDSLMRRLLILVFALTGCGGSGSDQQTRPVSHDAPPTLTVSGTIAGLTGTGLKLVAIGATVNGGQFSVEPGATRFTYSSPSTIIQYRIEIREQPSGQVCVLANNSGVLSQSFRAVEIICDDLPRDSLSGTYQINGRRSFVTFFSNGSFLLGSHFESVGCGENSGNGVEHGIYDWDSSTSLFSVAKTITDTNGICGFSYGPATQAGVSGTLERSGPSITLRAGDGTTHTLIAVPSVQWSVQGSWDTGAGFAGVVTFLPDSTYFQMRAHQFFDEFSNATLIGIEDGCYSATNWPSSTATFVTGDLSVDLSSSCNLPGGLAAIDTNGFNGLSSSGSVLYQIPDTTSMWYGPSSRTLISAQRITAD
jgi:hypothetical protein